MEMNKMYKWSLLPLAIPISMMVFMIPLHLELQESEVSMDALCVYNDDKLLSIPNVHYTEQYYECERGFPDFWNIKTVRSYVTAEFPNGDMKYYTVETDVGTGEYKLVNYNTNGSE
jgi:hypothetical protein